MEQSEIGGLMGKLDIGGTSTRQLNNEDGSVEIITFTDIQENITLHFQIIRLPKQSSWVSRKTSSRHARGMDVYILTPDPASAGLYWIYAWIGYNSAKLGHLHAAASTRPNNTVSVSSIFGGTSDNTGSSIARRLVLRTGLNILLACNIPKSNPMIEAMAEKKLLEKLISLGYTKPR